MAEINFKADHITVSRAQIDLDDSIAAFSRANAKKLGTSRQTPPQIAGNSRANEAPWDHFIMGKPELTPWQRLVAKNNRR